jgi:phosphoribosylglycinamide formyltransferase-1
VPFRVGVLFSERTDLAASLHATSLEATSLQATAGHDVGDPAFAVAGCATDREHDKRATPAGVPLRKFPIAGYSTRVERDLAIADWLAGLHIDLVVTAGWLWLLSPEFLDRYPDRVVNVHPTLLPAFPGRHSVEAAVAYGVRVHGVTVHLVDAGVDTGPILAQAASPFPEPVAPAAVRAALAPIERRLLAEVVGAFANGRVRRDGGNHRRMIVSPRGDLAEP